MSAPTSFLGQRVAAEAIGTALLLATVVGSGIMAETLAGGNIALALLCNAVATGAALVALILTFGSVSGAHFNPVVTLAEVLRRRLSVRDAVAYVIVQSAGAVLGVWLAHAMFDKPVLMVSQHARAGWAQGVSEVVATFGLVCTILGTARRRPEAIPFAVYWFTASTSFANPAVTLARSLTDTFAGIRPADVLPFVGAQIVGAVSAVGLFRWFHPSIEPSVVEPASTRAVPSLAESK
jgi:glycerol uptake facilitator-like aquaporin